MESSNQRILGKATSIEGPKDSVPVKYELTKLIQSGGQGDVFEGRNINQPN